MNKNIAGPLLLVAVVFLGGAGVLLSQNGSAIVTQSDISSTQPASVVEAVSRLIVLPEGETPTIAEVEDPEALKGQAFFSKAKKGDQVLIFAEAGRAYLYDPIADKVLEVAPVTFGENQ